MPSEQTLHGRIVWVRGMRAFADGFVSLLLPAYLIALGMGPVEVGLIATATLLGSGITTILVGLFAWRFEQRNLLLAAAALMALTGAGFAGLHQFWPLLLVAVAGTLNPSSGDVSVFLPLEHALLSRSVPDDRRTAMFARYSLAGSLMAALGSLCAGVPDLLAPRLAIDRLAVMQAMFLAYGAIGVACGVIYRKIPYRGSHEAKRAAAPLRESRKMVIALAALFSLDSFGGGLVVQSLIAFWLYQRFGLSIAVAGTIFFWTGLLSAGSQLLAPWIARRIGLVNTMVFTHLPANIFLVLVPFMPSLELAIVLLLLRSALSQMDVPTRSSYVMAVVPPEERTAAASVTAVPRSLASALSPMLAGYLLAISSFGWPLVAAGSCKILYDILLLQLCRRVPPPEERHDKPG
jgi:MFS family permease